MKLTKMRVSLHLRSGDKVIFHADEVTRRVNGDGGIFELRAIGSVDYPFYLRLDAVDAITSKRVLWLR